MEGGARGGEAVDGVREGGAEGFGGGGGRGGGGGGAVEELREVVAEGGEAGWAVGGWGIHCEDGGWRVGVGWLEWQSGGGWRV